MCFLRLLISMVFMVPANYSPARNYRHLQRFEPAFRFPRGKVFFCHKKRGKDLRNLPIRFLVGKGFPKGEGILWIVEFFQLKKEGACVLIGVGFETLFKGQGFQERQQGFL
jgi:hypothetical protein